jgi:uncharacterized damage-inducible protein DinB
MPRLTRRHLTSFVLPVAIAAGLGGPTRALLAQEVLDAKSAAHLRDQFLADLDTIHSRVMALAGAIPEDKYSWRPGPGVRSVSEVLGHLAGEYYYYVPQSVGARPHADHTSPRESLPKLEKLVGKQAMLDELHKAWTYGRAQLAGADPATLTGSYQPWNIPLARAAFGMAGDQHEHLGQLIAYARVNGVVPPWSKQ